MNKCSYLLRRNILGLWSCEQLTHRLWRIPSEHKCLNKFRHNYEN